jgi:hypothetical protein
MAGNTLTSASTLTCPHGASVTIVPANQRAMAEGVFIATAADVFTVVGCPFVLPTVPPTPSPCITVQWQVTDLRVKAGAPTLSMSSQGLCVSVLGPPQGPVTISPTQVKVSTR